MAGDRPGRDRVDVGGIAIDRVDTRQTVARCSELVRLGGPRHAAGVNASKIVDAQDDANFARTLREADLVNADGMSVVWASRVLGDGLPERVTGIDLVGPMLDMAVDNGWPVYFLGARAEIIARAVRVLEEAHPGLEVAGFRDGYIRGEEEAAVAGVRASGARVAFIGLHSPMKEELFDEYRDHWGDCLVVGIGGSFDVIAGEISRAPRWAQRMGLEWLHRLMSEPRRLWKRYLFGNTRFIALVLRQRIRPR
ncbi:WecB/TagA/CpsF family glycosyltransferase [Janibacter sp. YIM B02568]|uniref:WecB/TagA/CpsF family glycosyltransferase n=1 Tax=Janibacter endophyticus TaxID=2806261 RepID=UPI0019518DA3|nr:WecB/TagA/CpsF family glycosyltransferase [Janibacter endophyticus]MBM6547008.1 WecB/TagA/CpsF family glycosyltransferase [Janibacter endophyticus]